MSSAVVSAGASRPYAVLALALISTAGVGIWCRIEAARAIFD